MRRVDFQFSPSRGQYLKTEIVNTQTQEHIQQQTGPTQGSRPPPWEASTCGAEC